MSNFNLKKYLIENKLTTLSRKGNLNENVDYSNRTLLNENVEYFVDEEYELITDLLRAELRGYPEDIELDDSFYKEVASEVSRDPRVQRELLNYCDGNENMCEVYTRLLNNFIVNNFNKLTVDIDTSYDDYRPDELEDLDDYESEFYGTTTPRVEKPRTTHYVPGKNEKYQEPLQ